MTTTAAGQFRRLRVAAVEKLTDEAVYAVTFDVPDSLAAEFSYLPGQHVTVKTDLDGVDVRRSYSICANANQGKLRIGIKQLPGGAFSTFATTELAAGDELRSCHRLVSFTTVPRPVHYGAVAVGKRHNAGPVPRLHLPRIRARMPVLGDLGNRGADSVMFLDELEGLKDRYPERVQIIHVLSREQALTPLLSGRLDEARLAGLLDSVVAPARPEEWFLCGPFEMVGAARRVLEERGVPAAMIHDELFFAGPLDLNTLPAEPPDETGTVRLTFTLDGRESAARMRRETSILDAALRVRPELPYSCKGGMCASCKARVVTGEVAMAKNWALVDAEVAEGYVLTCQSHPLTDAVEVDFEV